MSANDPGDVDTERIRREVERQREKSEVEEQLEESEPSTGAHGIGGGFGGQSGGDRGGAQASPGFGGTGGSGGGGGGGDSRDGSGSGGGADGGGGAIAPPPTDGPGSPTGETGVPGVEQTDPGQTDIKTIAVFDPETGRRTSAQVPVGFESGAVQTGNRVIFHTEDRREPISISAERARDIVRRRQAAIQSAIGGLLADPAGRPAPNVSRSAGGIMGDALGPEPGAPTVNPGPGERGIPAGDTERELDIPSNIRGAPQRPAAKIEAELEQATGADLQLGRDFRIEVTDEGFEPVFTPAGRIKIAGVPETGETFFDREAINPFIAGVESDIEASAAVDAPGLDFGFAPGPGDLVQQIKADLRRDAQIHREGMGLLPSGEQAEAAVEPIATAKQEAGLPFVSSPNPDIAAGFAARAGTTINPAGIALGVAEGAESVGEFSFNKVVGSLNPPETVETAEGEEIDLTAGVLDIPALELGEFETTPTPGPGPATRERTGGVMFGGGTVDIVPVFKEFEEVTAEAKQRAQAQEAAFGAAAVGLGAATVESFEEQPARTGGAALFEAGLLFGGEAVSPFRVRSISVPTKVGGKTTIRGLRLETPRVLRSTGRRTAGRTLVSQRGFGLTRGVPEIAPDVVDLERLPGRAATTERIAPFETEILGATGRLGGPAAARRIEAQEGVVDIGREVGADELKLTTTREIVGEVESVPVAKVEPVAEALNELEAELFGSAALRAQFPETFRKPGDLDIVVADEAAARARLGEALEGANAGVGDIFDIKTAEKAPRPGDPVKLGRFAGPRLETEGGLKVVPAAEELTKKGGASGFLRGAGTPAPRFAGETDIFDIGPEPNPSGQPRFKDVGDTAAIVRAIIGREAARTMPFEFFKRRRISKRSEAVREFEEAFESELSAVPVERQQPTLQALPEPGGVVGGLPGIDLDAVAKRIAGEPDRAQFALPGIVGPGGGREAAEQVGGGVLALGGDLFPSPLSGGRAGGEAGFGLPLRPPSGGRDATEDIESPALGDGGDLPSQSSLTESIVGGPGRASGLARGGLFGAGLLVGSGGGRGDEFEVGGGAVISPTTTVEEPGGGRISPITAPSAGGVGGGDDVGGGLTLPGSGFDSPTEPGGGGVTVPSPAPTTFVPTGEAVTLFGRRIPGPDDRRDRDQGRTRAGFEEVQFIFPSESLSDLLGFDIGDEEQLGFQGAAVHGEPFSLVTGVSASRRPTRRFEPLVDDTELDFGTGMDSGRKRKRRETPLLDGLDDVIGGGELTIPRIV